MENTYDSVLKYFDKYIMEKQPDEVERDRWLDHFGHDDYILFALAYAAKFQAAPARIVGDEEIEDASDDRWDVLKKDRLCWEDRVGFFTGFSSGAKWALSRQTAIVLPDEEEIKQLFRAKSNCYADTWSQDGIGAPMVEGDVIQAMTEDAVINLFKTINGIKEK